MLERQAFGGVVPVRRAGRPDVGDLLRTARVRVAAAGACGPDPRVADVVQAAYRSWYIEEELPELPRIDIEVVLRIQRPVSPPDPRKVPRRALPSRARRSAASACTVRSDGRGGGLEDLTETEHAIEISYEAAELDEATLADGSTPR